MYNSVAARLSRPNGMPPYIPAATIPMEQHLMEDVMSRFVDLSGQKFSRLTVVNRAPNYEGCTSARWRCVCSCGNISFVSTTKLRSSHTRSCGCLRKELASSRNIKSKGDSYIHRMGVNDADYKTKDCPFYDTWRAMLERCYSSKSMERQPTYSQCTVDPDWHYFSVFKEWMESQDWKGMDLDKDIIEPGNKHYSAEYCCFVPHPLNGLLGGSAAIRGKYPQGVDFLKKRGKYRAKIQVNGKSKTVGQYDTVRDAENAYRSMKALRIAVVASQQSDERVKAGLWKHVELYRVIK